MLQLTPNLPSLVAKRFIAAKESGTLIFSPTQLTTIQSSGVVVSNPSSLFNQSTYLSVNHDSQFQLRYCPALAKKPTAKPEDEARRGPKPDPFENPPPEMLIAEIPSPHITTSTTTTTTSEPTHFLVLNKFPVIPNHFILATKAFKLQTALLEEDDLEIAYACLKAWAASDEGNTGRKRRLFGFFNSGDASGASQPNRHLQFLPIEDMRGQEEKEGQGTLEWEPLIDQLLTPRAVTTQEGGFRQLPGLPFLHFALPVPRDPSADALHRIYLSLYNAAVRATQPHTSGQSQEYQTSGESVIAYNLALTESAMMICPRRKDSASLPIQEQPLEGDVANAGSVSFNGTILGGTLMVKAESEWNQLRNQPLSLDSLLADIGFPVRSENVDVNTIEKHNRNKPSI